MNRPGLRDLAGALALLASAGACVHSPCSAAPLAVEVLGSGGPIPDDDRASSAYVICVDGRSRVLIDAGGGSFVRFAEAGARFEALDFVGLTHLHVDHSTDLPALLEAGFFSARTRPLIVAGPDHGGSFPGIGEWLTLLLGPAGAYRYLDWELDEHRGPWHVDVRELDHRSREAVEIDLDNEGLRIAAIGVTHGPVPALAYRVEIDGHAIVFSGDQNGDDPEFVAFARGAELLVMNHAIGEHPDEVAEQLHAKPSEIAEIARAAGVETLVLSHHMARSLVELERSRQTILRRFDGRLEVAEDHGCYTLD